MRPAVHPAGAPNFGPNVYIFTPSMPQSQIQATVDSIASQQVGNQFGTQRYALLFEPGTYGSAADPLFFQVGYYTSVAGLGASPGDVVINGAVDSFNQCSAGSCTALVNFWRSLSNLTINFPAPPPGAPCSQTAEFWATSQASPVRRVDVNGFTSLEDYCSAPSYSSGGFIADSQFSGSTVLNGTQQQFVVRNSNLDGWTNGVWNQVFSGDVGRARAELRLGRPVHDAGRPARSPRRSRSCSRTLPGTTASSCRPCSTTRRAPPGAAAPRPAPPSRSSGSSSPAPAPRCG